MPVKRCMDNNKPGWKFGDSGKCYTYISGNEKSSNDAKRKAHLQGVAIGEENTMNKQIKAVHLIKEKKIKEENGNIFESIGNIDLESHTIKNVCVFGTRYSANNRVYQDSAINKIKEFAEGAKVFIDHPSKEEIKNRDGVRSLRDWAGVYSNVRKDGDKIYADLTCREAYFGLVKDIATLQPKSVGNSINVRAKSFVDEKTKIESIVDVVGMYSIDLVTSAATTQSLFESAIEDNMKNNIDAVFSDEYVSLKVEKKFEEVMAAEGVIQNKINADKIKYAISDMTYTVSDMVRDILCEDEMSLAEKKKKIETRLGLFTNSLAVIRVGASTENEQKGLKYKVEDAVNAVKAAYKGGVVCGAGMALARLNTSSPILNAALKYPALQLCENMGLDETEPLDGEEALNVVTGQRGNFMDVGVMDPVEVLIAGVESAVSIASSLLTSSGMILEYQDDKN